MFFRKIIRALLVVALGWVLLWLGASTYAKFAYDIELKNPLDVFSFLFPEQQAPEIDINTPTIDVNPGTNPGESGTTTPDGPEIDINKPEIDVNKPEIDITKPEIENPEIIIDVNSGKKQMTVDELVKLTENIRVSGPETTETYDRDKFEKPSHKFEFEGEKLTRNKYAWHISKWLIKNDETGFEYYCPYTGIIITDPSKIDFDHIIPLQYTFYHGGYAWDDDKKNTYSYDFDIGVDVSQSSNRSKGAAGPSEWLPSENKDDYCYTWFVIANEYDISMTEKDISVCKLEVLNAISSGEEIGMINPTILEED